MKQRCKFIFVTNTVYSLNRMPKSCADSVFTAQCTIIMMSLKFRQSPASFGIYYRIFNIEDILFLSFQLGLNMSNLILKDGQYFNHIFVLIV